jgi:hypothetical protein
MRNERYLQFPLFLIRDLFTDKEKAINNIITYGIYRFSQKQDYSIVEVARQLIYGYYRKGLTTQLRTVIERYVDNGEIEIDEDYNGFNGRTFNPDTEIEQILPLFETDSDFKELAIEYYLIKQAYCFLGIKGNMVNCLKEGKKIEKLIPLSEPFPMVNIDLLFAFRDNPKSEIEIAQFTAFISVRSILGVKPYCRTNKEMIVCRMFGYASKKQLPNQMKPKLKELFDKYSIRYHIDKVLQCLELNWNIRTYSKNMRGLYVAVKNKISIDNLALIAERKKKLNQIKALKAEKNQAKEKALQQLNKEQHFK